MTVYETFIREYTGTTVRVESTGMSDFEVGTLIGKMADDGFRWYSTSYSTAAEVHVR